MDFPIIKKICILLSFYLSMVTLGMESANVSVFYVKFIIFSKNKENFLQSLAVAYYCGAIIGALIFCFSFFKKKHFKILLIADFSIIMGSILMCTATNTVQILMGRGLIGLGLCMTSLSLPILVYSIWPKNMVMLASSGLFFQIGMLLSDFLSWVILSYYILSPFLGGFSFLRNFKP